MLSKVRLARRLLGLRLLLGAVLAFHWLPATSAAADGKVALIVGNGSYDELIALENAQQDARLIGDKLRDLDFDVLEIIDADRSEMEQALREFGKKAEQAEVALFFYAGHGVQVSGENYLLPVTASIGDQGDLRYETILLTTVMDELEYADPEIAIVVLDACRENPLKQIAGEPISRSLDARDGLASVRGATGTLIAYATAPGDVAYDGIDGGNSPFSTALARWIDEPGLEIGLMFRRVRQDVVTATQGLQVPWVEEAILGDFYFVEDRREVAPLLATAGKVFDIADPEAVFWRTITELQAKEGRRAGLNLYLSVFPEGRFADEARLELFAIDQGGETDNLSMQLSDLAPPGAGAFTDILFWDNIRDSIDPDDFEDYLERFPDGLFAGLAAERLTQLLTAVQVAVLDPNLTARSFRIPLDSGSHPLVFQADEVNRALSSAQTTVVHQLPDVGDILIGGQKAGLGDVVNQVDLDRTNFVPKIGITGHLGQFTLAASEPDGAEILLSADIHVQFQEEPVREVAAVAGVGPVPITIPLPATTGSEERELIIDALPYRSQLLTADEEVSISGRVAVMDGIAELAISLPEEIVGDAGQIVYSYVPTAAERPEGLSDQADGSLQQEAIAISGIQPDYTAQREFDAFVGVGRQPLDLTLPEDESVKVLVENMPFGDLHRSDGTHLEIGDYLPAAALKEATFEAHRDLVGPMGQLVYSYQTEEGDRLIHALEIDASIHDCDLLAANPFDPDRVSDGKWLWRARGEGREAESYLDSPAAILACLAASDAFPDVDRFQLQVSRAYLSAKDWENALKWITPLAEQGNIVAISGLAWHYSNGWGVPVDHERAYEMWVYAANHGFVPAAHELGKAYRDGRGVERNDAEAARWIKVASDWGFDWAQFNLGKLYRDGLGVPQSDQKAVELFQKAYDQRNAFGMLELARMYLVGRGVPKDPERAKQLLTEISEAREVEWALFQLGQMYLRGEDIERDVQKAIELFEDAADRGVAPAKIELARLHLQGDGLDPDPERAVELLETAIGDGATFAYYVLAKALETGEGVPQDRARAIALYQQGAAAGDTASLNRLGQAYRTGDQVPKDYVKARRLFEEANQAGNVWSVLSLAEMERRGEGGIVNPRGAILLLADALRRAQNDSLTQAAVRGIEAIPNAILVEAVQGWLKREGFDPGPADGKIGPKTRQAIEAFEKSQDLPSTGNLSPELIAALAP